MRVLVCGGAGYIGAHMVELLSEAGHEAVVFDNLEGGHAEHVTRGRLEVGDLRDPRALDALFAGGAFDAVMHFAGKIVVGESVDHPAAYYEHNVTGTLNLLQATLRHGASPVVFSSSAAVYGSPQYTPIDESHPCKPLNPYGWSKLIGEQMLADLRTSPGLRSVSLRYFNAAGSSPSGAIAEMHEPETHLIPNVLRAARTGGTVDIFGDDYSTPDGSCVRDYIHVSDLCRAHLLALEHLGKGGDNLTLNLGSGEGHSVHEVIAVAERICGRAIARRMCARRPGDPPSLVATARKAHEELGWRATQSDLPAIIESAWRSGPYR